MKKLLWITIGIIVLVGIGWWVWKEINKPLVGQSVPEMGRDHTVDISGVIYNSNPPTSGPHFSVWAKQGAYDRVISDGYLIHSLEHGYVVISYNCTKLNSNVNLPDGGQMLKLKVYAHETGDLHDELVSEGTSSGKLLTRMTFQPQGLSSWFNPENAPAVEIELPENFKSEKCQSLVKNLSGFLNNYKRLIIVPRIDLDVSIVLTAWGRIEKLNFFDKNRIKQFIQIYHNRGPEKTME